MRRTLYSLLLTTSLVLADPVSSEERQELETDNRKPHEIVREYLEDRGVAREEFRVSHYFYKNPDGIVHYNRDYNFKGTQFIEQYELSDELRFKQEGTFRFLFAYPSAFFLEGTWYYDIHRDGFNGNEIEGTDSAESTKPEDRKLEKIPIKCIPKERECRNI